MPFDEQASRLNVTLQGYDQVIALSQAHINATLKARYRFNEVLRKVDITNDVTYASILAELDPPTVELIDQRGADRAIFWLNFKSGTFTYYKKAPPPTGRGPPINVPCEVQVKGWRLALFVDFSLKALSSVDHIKDPSDREQVKKAIETNVLKPGSYSVSQLLIDFTSPSVLSSVSAFSSSDLPGIDTRLGKDTEVKVELGNLFSAQIEYLAKDGSHNILGHALTVPEPSKAATFQPTQARPQIIAHRPDGEETKVTQTDPFNAFCFTEMCSKGPGDTRKMPDHDLAWSGHLFQKDLGASLVMAKELFIDAYLLPTLHVPVNLSSIDLLNILAIWLTSAKAPEQGAYWQWLLSFSRPSAFEAAWKPEGNGAKCTWTNGSYSADDVDTRGKLNYFVRNTFQATVTNTLTPVAGTGDVRIASTLHVEVRNSEILAQRDDLIEYSKEDKHGPIVEYHLSHVYQTRTVDVEYTTTIAFASVADGGLLQVALRPAAITKCTSRFDDQSVWNALFGTKGQEDVDKELSKRIADLARERITSGTDTKQIAEVLNKQKTFVLPGGGDFQMKDPMFGNTGNLLVGLSYKQRASDLPPST